jgi:uncharacterized Zn-binding protein involved in type VI secretion
MGNKAHRMDDANTGGGKITTIPQSTVFANSKVLAVNGSKGTGHGIGVHATNQWDTANGSSTVKCHGIPVNSEGDADTCTHTRTGGSGDVNIGG